MLIALTGAEDALVVNNCAAALMLALAALAKGKQVLVSRGELIEIGGEFRIPDIMAASGAKLVEVGTTNRTRIGDYRAAFTDRVGAVLKVHPSNYRVVGFTASTPATSSARSALGAGCRSSTTWGRACCGTGTGCRRTSPRSATPSRTAPTS